MNLTARAAVYPPVLCAAILRGIAAQHTREGRCPPTPVRKRLERGRADYDLSEASLAGEPELQRLAAEAAEGADPVAGVEVGDAEIVDVASLGEPTGEEPRGPAWPEGSDGGLAGDGSQHFRDDITGAVLPLELVAAARSEEIRFMEFWGVWDARPVSERLSRARKRPIGGRWVDRKKGDAITPNRSRCVSKEIVHYKDDSMFAATPP
eukprot:2555040-Alexandrium_andersonii.AAC.1